MSSAVEINHEEKCDANGKNKYRIGCRFCPSIILNPAAGTFLIHEVDLPFMRGKRNKTDEEEVEKLKYYWLIEDMYTFENATVTKTVGNVKYLACADCEIGPFGYIDLSTKNCYLAVSRVIYKDSPES